MLNSKIIGRFWVTAPAIAWAMLMSANGAFASQFPKGVIAAETQTGAESEGSALVQMVDGQRVAESASGTQRTNDVESRLFASSDFATPTTTEAGVTIDAVSQVADSLTQANEALTPDPFVPGSAEAMGQVTNVSQLSDVKPTDWAFQALSRLISNYGCIAGYPDGTFRGNSAMTRYEFAAGLNACLDAIAEKLGTGVSQEDLEQIRRLQQEFQAELATLRGRVDALEARVTELEANKFSTTTTLRGLAVFNLTGAFAGDPVTAERNPFVANVPFVPPTRDAANVPTRVQRDEPNIVFDYLLWLNLTTSFTGKDQLVTQLAMGNGSSPANQYVSSGFFNTWGAPFLSTTPAPGGAVNVPVIRELFYSFPIGDDIRVTVGPRVNFYRHFDGNRFTFFITGATTFNSNGSTLSNAVDRGSGAVVAWTISPQFRFTIGYLGQNSEFLGNNTANDPAFGLFGGTNTLTGELAYSPSRNFNLRLLYTRSNLQAANGFVSGEPVPYGIIDDGFGGPVEDATADTFIVNFDWLITKGFGIFGRYSYGSTNVNPVNPALSGGEVNTQSIQFGLGFPDLGKPGALGVFSFLIPHDYLSGRRFLLSGGGDGATQYELELSYYYPLTDNIAIVPAFYAIINPNSFDSNPTVFVGNLRTQFSF